MGRGSGAGGGSGGRGRAGGGGGGAAEPPKAAEAPKAAETPKAGGLSLADAAAQLPDRKLTLLSDFKKQFPNMSHEEFSAEMIKLRNADKISLEVFEGRHEATRSAEQLAGQITQHGRVYTYVAKRPTD